MSFISWFEVACVVRVAEVVLAVVAHIAKLYGSIPVRASLLRPEVSTETARGHSMILVSASLSNGVKVPQCQSLHEGRTSRNQRS